MTETAVLLADNGLNGGATAPLPAVNQATGPENDTHSEEKIDREQLLIISTDLILSLHRRISGRRFRGNKHDSVKLGYARALVAALQCHSSIIKDLEQEEIKARLGRIEAALEIREQERKYLEQVEREQAKRRRL